MSSDTYILVGLTGSIGSGKSSAARVFEECGIPVLRSDQIAKELMVSDPEMMEELRDAFGDGTYTDGVLNRSHLASQIFSDRRKLELMNSIVHPRTIAEQGRRANALVEEGYRVVACEAALIFESGGEGRFDYIVVVDADREIRLDRAAGRDRTSIEEVMRRDDSQIPAERKVEMADFVIKNNGTLDELERNTRFLATLLKSLPPRQKIETDEADAGEAL
ncbi:MAG: dephospho-CoA kinase [Chlorobi bacterium]|nr:dephospho-CoA kinase [Chlorobiota bacterium]